MLLRFIGRCQTPLMNAIIYKQLKLVKELLNSDDLNLAAVSYHTGDTALHFACVSDSSVALLGQDKRMTSQILNIKNNGLETA